MPFLGGPARSLAVAVCIPDIDGLERRMAPGGAIPLSWGAQEFLTNAQAVLLLQRLHFENHPCGGGQRQGRPPPQQGGGGHVSHHTPPRTAAPQLLTYQTREQGYLPLRVVVRFTWHVRVRDQDLSPHPHATPHSQ